MSERLDDVENVIWAHHVLGESNWLAGDFDKAAEHFKEGIKIVEERRGEIASVHPLSDAQ